MDPRKWAPAMYRRAFTLARATEATTVGRVHRAVAEAIRDGHGGTPAVHRALTEAGLSDENGSYAELVWRTASMSAYNEGAQAEMSHPDLEGVWGGWEYLAVPDSRARPAHAARHGRIYPMSATFSEVRGTGPGDVIQCRCSFAPLTKQQVEQRLANGGHIEKKL